MNFDFFQFVHENKIYSINHGAFAIGARVDIYNLLLNILHLAALYRSSSSARAHATEIKRERDFCAAAVIATFCTFDECVQTVEPSKCTRYYTTNWSFLSIITHVFPAPRTLSFAFSVPATLPLTS